MSVRHLKLAQVISSDMNLGPEKSVVFLHTTDARLPLCIIEFQVAFLDATVNCVKWQRYCSRAEMDSNEFTLFAKFFAMLQRMAFVANMNVNNAGLRITECLFFYRRKLKNT